MNADQQCEDVPGSKHNHSTTKQSKPKPGFSRSAPVYTEQNLKDNLAELVHLALVEMREDDNLKVNGSVNGHAVAAMAHQIASKLGSGFLSLPENLITQLSAQLWEAVTSGDKEKTYSAYNEHVWTGFYKILINKAMTQSLINFCKVCFIDNAQHVLLFQTVRVFLLNLVTILGSNETEQTPSVMNTLLY
ncbi:uncharacterized protein LOC100371180 [Saccoglossus kowalevskii]|uniref:Uncharacterized protein LOC100371180 n=1 Tax=Saccoglossus kowalevskii TaxID=10224 RepID=A0ABM0GY93_SACKO|nr:PREDICTED: uncharacterized protein LOC100371180 [Saccoglossus kowalevskii]